MTSPYTEAQTRFQPLIDALTPLLGPAYRYEVQTTGGWVMCLFIRRDDDPEMPDRCAVFSDHWDEPDETAYSAPLLGLYRDWDDEDDMGVMHENDAIRPTAATAPAIAAWATPLIRGWLDV